MKHQEKLWIYQLNLKFQLVWNLNLLRFKQAIVRSDINQKNKGREAASACIELLK